MFPSSLANNPQLCGLQALSDGFIDRARKLVFTQVWITDNARDLIDESDAVLSPKSGLTFPSGNVSAPDGSPFRWTVSESILKLVEMHLAALKSKYPQSIEIVSRAGAYPILHFLRRDIENDLLDRVSKSIISGHDAILPVKGLSAEHRALLAKFLAEPIVSEDDTKSILMLFADDPDALKRLLLLRGLLVQRILLLCLKRRFNVQYGIDHRRAPISVPFM